MDDTQMTALRNLKTMLDEGILTQSEFDEKKKAILDILAGSGAPAPATKKTGAPQADAPCVDKEGRLKLLMTFQDSTEVHMSVKPTTTLFKITHKTAEHKHMGADIFSTTYRVLLDGERVSPSTLVSEETITDLLARYEYKYDDDHIEFEMRIAQVGGRR